MHEEIAPTDLSETSTIHVLSQLTCLDEWSDRDWQNGVQVDQMKMLDTLFVRTRNSLYELTVLRASEGEVLIRGGELFQEWTTASLSGSSQGGALLKLRGVYVGLKMELQCEHGTIVTSPIETIAVNPG